MGQFSPSSLDESAVEDATGLEDEAANDVLDVVWDDVEFAFEVVDDVVFPEFDVAACDVVPVEFDAALFTADFVDVVDVACDVVPVEFDAVLFTADLVDAVDVACDVVPDTVEDVVLDDDTAESVDTDTAAEDVTTVDDEFSDVLVTVFACI